MPWVTPASEEDRYPVQLTDTQIRTAKPRERQYRLADGQGLHLLVRPNGSKLRQMRYWVAGKEKTLSLGPYPLVTLAKARQERLEAKRLVADGLDPNEVKRREQEADKLAQHETFGALVADYLSKQEREERAPRTLAKNRWLLKMATDDFGSLSVHEITPPLILKTLRAVEAKGNHETANRLRSVIGTVFRYGVATGIAKDDPTAALKGALVRPRRKHRAAITDQATFGRLLRAIEHYEGQRQTVLGLKLLALLAPRPGELQHARWDEVDFEQKVWTIPAERMKMRREHRVPLPEEALGVLRELHALNGSQELLFPSLRSPRRPVSENTFNQALRNLGFSKDEMTAHGFRTTFSTLANESGLWNPDAIERALARAEQDEVRRAYARGEFWEERVRLAEWWGGQVEQMRLR
jgi:integrase